MLGHRRAVVFTDSAGKGDNRGVPALLPKAPDREPGSPLLVGAETPPRRASGPGSPVGLLPRLWQGMDHMAPTGSFTLSDEVLARALKVGDPNARPHVRDRFAPLAGELAQRICRRIGHRGRPCPGRTGSFDDCDCAFTWVELDLLDRFAGRDATDGRRARKALIVTWLEQDRRSPSFAAYVRGRGGDGLPGMVSDGRRAWNRARGLRTRVYMPASMWDQALPCYQDLIARGQEADAARRLGVEEPPALRRCVEALFDDACETGLVDPIDIARVARHLCGGLWHDPAIEAATAILAPAVDTMLWRRWPNWWHEYLDRPRQHTRLWLPLPPAPQEQLPWAA